MSWFSHRVAVGAVAEHAAQAAARLSLDAGLEAERVGERLLGRSGAGRRELAADLAPGGLDLAQACGRGRDAPGQPASERRVRARRIAARARVRRDRPFVAGASARAGHAVARDQPRGPHAGEVGADTVGVQPEARGQLVGRGAAAEVCEQAKEPAAGRLREHVSVPVAVREVDPQPFSHPGWEKPLVEWDGPCRSQDDSRRR